MARFRRKGKASEPATDNVDLSDGDHAWWANTRVQHAPTFTPEQSDPPAATAAAAEDTPWVYTDVFAADVDGAIDRELGADAADAAGQGPGARNLADVLGEESAFRTLGLEPGAAWEDVVLAHRQMAQRFPPGRLIHAEDHEQAEGERKMIEANAAYETLRKLRRPHSHTTGLFTG